MHDIEPYYSWLKYYNSSEDENSPYYGKEYNYDVYSETIYNYYINPAWDYMVSDTLYLKILYVDYIQEFIIIEFIGARKFNSMFIYPGCICTMVQGFHSAFNFKSINTCIDILGNFFNQA